MSRFTTSYDTNLVDQLISEFITRCNYVSNKSLINILKKPAIGAAELCKQLNVDAATYVEAHTRNAPVIRGYTSLVPQQLYCKDSKRYVEEFLSLQGEVSKQDEFETQCRLFAKCIQNGWDEQLALLNPTFDFLPYFRILLSPIRNEELIAKYGPSAAHILNHDRDLLSYLKTIKAEDGSSFDFSRIPNLYE